MPVADGVHVDMGHGWDVWLDRDTVCRSEPVDAAAPDGPRYQPFGCRSLTDGNIGGINVQSEISPTGSMLSGLLPQRAARIAVRLDGTTLDASLVHFRDRPGWTFWYAWLPGDGTDARVTAYDDAGGVLDRTG
jgi:hypothetical protein